MATEIYELSVQGAVQGQYDECVLHWIGTGLTANETLVNGNLLISGWVATCQALWLATLPSSYSLNRLAARRATPSPSAVAHAQYQAFIVSGTRGTDAVSFNLCPSIFLVPGMGVKSGGRVFMPCVGAADIVNNGYLPAYITALANAFNTMIGGFSGSGVTWNLAVFSRKLLTASLVTQANFSGRLGFQGKRRYPAGT